MKIISTLLLLMISGVYTSYALENTRETLQSKYAHGEPIRILLVAGHDDQYSGAQFGDATEAMYTHDMAQILKGYLSQDKQIQVTMIRDENRYNQQFLQYALANSKNIMTQVVTKKNEMNQLMAQSSTTLDTQVGHIDATSSVVELLYSINSWAEQEGFDMVIHVHFNDYGSRYEDDKGKYSGFAIYSPSKELVNATTSHELGDAIGKRLKKTFTISNHPEESEYSNENGVIPDYYLIAMGAYKTASMPRVLVEYSYIYEPHLRYDAQELFSVSAQTLARATDAGIHDFLIGDMRSQYTKRRNLGYTWYETVKQGKTATGDALALQFALHELGYFPPKAKKYEECFFSGVFGSCTKRALTAFQKQYGLTGNGIVGPTTRKVLNIVFAE